MEIAAVIDARHRTILQPVRQSGADVCVGEGVADGFALGDGDRLDAVDDASDRIGLGGGEGFFAVGVGDVGPAGAEHLRARLGNAAKGGAGAAAGEGVAMPLGGEFGDFLGGDGGFFGFLRGDLLEDAGNARAAHFELHLAGVVINPARAADELGAGEGAAQFIFAAGAAEEFTDGDVVVDRFALDLLAQAADGFAGGGGDLRAVGAVAILGQCARTQSDDGEERDR